MNDRKVARDRFLLHILCLLMTVLLVWVLSSLFAIILVSPDDVAFQNIMSGEMTGRPDGHTYFLRYPLSAFLSLFYQIAGSVSWYHAFLMGSLAICVYLIFVRVTDICVERRIIYLIGGLLLVTLVFARDIVRLEWTVTAGVLGATAIFRYVTMTRNMSAGKAFFEYGICVALLLVCFCLRNTVAYMFIPLAGICWLRNIVLIVLDMRGVEKKRQLLRNIIFLVVCILVVGLVFVSHKLAYSTEEWKAYQTYTKDRSALFDYYGYPDYDTYQDAYEAAGISKEAYVLMESDYNFLVPCDNFQEMDIAAIADLAESIHFEDPVAKLRGAAKEILGILKSEDYFVLNALILGLIVCNFAVKRERRILNIVYVSAVILWAGALAFYLSYDGRFPERVVKCLDYGMIMALAGNLLTGWMREGKKVPEFTLIKKCVMVALVVILIVCMVFGYSDFQAFNTSEASLALAHLHLMEYCSSHPENGYFRDFWSFSQRGELFMIPGYDSTNYLGIGGWTYHSPLYDALLERWDCYDFYQAVRENGNLYYLVSSDRLEEVRDRLNAYFWEEDLGIYMTIVDEFTTARETVYVLKFTSRF